MRNKTAALGRFPDQGSSRYSKKTFLNLVKYRSYSGTRSMLTNQVCELFLFHPDTWSFQHYLTEVYKIVLNRQLWYQRLSKMEES